MGIWDRLRAELIDIVEWTDDSSDTIVYRFERRNNEIKYGAKLTVREGQSAVFVNEGKIADVFPPGMYTLQTQNLPILSTLQGWKYGFESPFKAEVYFVNTRRFTDLKWGTMNPVMLRDPEFGPVRVRAFGTYVLKVTDPAALIREVVGTDGHFTTDEISTQIRNTVVSRFAEAVGEAKLPVLDLAANYNRIGALIGEKIQKELSGYGIDLTSLLVENISLPPEVEAAMDKRTSMGVVGDMRTFTQYQTATAIPDAAKNPSGGAGAGMGLGAGIAMGQQMASSVAGAMSSGVGGGVGGGAGGGVGGAGGPGGPPPIPTKTAAVYFVAVGTQQTGPFELSALGMQARSGQLTRDSLVWCAGMAGWTAAGQVPELADVFGSVPPPLPRG